MKINVRPAVIQPVDWPPKPGDVFVNVNNNMEAWFTLTGQAVQPGLSGNVVNLHSGALGIITQPMTDRAFNGTYKNIGPITNFETERG